MRRRGGCRGQASVEAIALVPVMVIVVLIVWQLAVLVRGALLAYDDLRADAMSAAGSGTVHVTSVVRVPTLLPGVGTLAIPVRAAVRAP